MTRINRCVNLLDKQHAQGPGSFASVMIRFSWPGPPKSVPVWHIRRSRSQSAALSKSGNWIGNEQSSL